MSSYVPSKNLAFETHHPLGISIDLPWDGYGYFLELHINIIIGFFFINFVDLNGTGSTVSGNLGTVVNVGNFSGPSDNVIKYQATMRAADIVQNVNGRALTVVSDTSVGGFDQLSNSISLKVCTITCFVVSPKSGMCSSRKGPRKVTGRGRGGGGGGGGG